MDAARAMLLAALAVGLVLVIAGPARADEQLSAVPIDNYSSGLVTIDQGEALMFANLDLLDRHDVTSEKSGSDGRPLFASTTIGAGQTAPVEGVPYLTTGHYLFYCSIHQFMTGTLHVTSAGTPLPRPGDATPPALKLTVASRKLKRVAKRGKLVVAVEVDEKSTVDVVASARRVTLGKTQVSFAGPGSRSVAIAVTKRGLKLLRKREKLRISVAAVGRDAVGNVRETAAARTLGG